MNNICTSKFYFAHKFSKYEEMISKFANKEHFSKNTILTNYGEINNTSNYISRGIVKFSLSHENGEEKTISFFGEGSIFPIGISEYKYKMAYDIKLMAFSDIEIYRFSYLKLRQMAENNPNFAIELLEDDCHFMSYLFQDIVNRSFSKCITRVADILYLSILSGLDENKTLAINQKSLTELVGASQPQVERALRHFREENIIETSRNKIKILNFEELQKYCSANVLE